MPYNIKGDNVRKGNQWGVGDIGENWVKYKLSQKRIDSIIIDRTYDLFAWQRGHRIEVKTSTLKRRNNNNGHYYWNFKYWQTKRDAFDYAVLVGLDEDRDVSVYYVIPQKYIHTHATKLKPNKDGSAKIMIRESVEGDFILEGNSYQKFTPCRNLSFDIFLQENKSAFTRKKNALAKEILEYSVKHKISVLKAVKEAFNNEDIKFPTKELRKKFGCSIDIIIKARKLLGISSRGNISYTCKKCGYTTHDKQRYRKHLNRKRPCTAQENKRRRGKK